MLGRKHEMATAQFYTSHSLAYLANQMQHPKKHENNENVRTQA